MNDNTLIFLTPTPEDPDSDNTENDCENGACALPTQPQSGHTPPDAEPAKTTETERTQ